MTPQDKQRAPRSGGRTVARDARDYQVAGTAALKVQPAPVERPRLRVAPPAPIAAPRAPFVLLVLIVVIGGVLGILALNTRINENAFKLDDLNGQQSTLTVQEQQLQQELAEKEASGNLEAEAKRLGLIPGGEPAYLRLPDGRVIGVPQPAGAARSGSGGR